MVPDIKFLPKKPPRRGGRDLLRKKKKGGHIEGKEERQFEGSIRDDRVRVFQNVGLWAQILFVKITIFTHKMLKEAQHQNLRL